MDSNKVYKDIVYLLYNVLDQEKLRYELYKDQKYRDLYILLVNDLLTLEKEHDAKFNDEQWATSFGKAIVVISQAKQRFERLDNKAIEKIYEDYSKMIAYSMNSFEVKRDVLTKDSIKFSKADVLYNGRLAEDVIKKYDDLAKEAEAKATAEKNAQDTIFVNDQKKENPNQQQAGWNPYQGQPNGQAFQDFAANMPQNPMQDPRFYPFDRKPKYMPWLKIALGIVVIISAIILIVASGFAMSKSVNFSESMKGLAIGKWNVTEDIAKNNTKIKHLIDISNNWSLAGGDKNAAMNIIVYIFYCIPAVYVGIACFRKPRSLADKYRIGYWPILFMIVFFALSIIDTYQFAAVSEIESTWKTNIKGLIASGQWNDGTFDKWFNALKSAQQIQAVTILMDVAIGFLGLSVVLGVAVCFFNPKIDKMKYQKAMNEYQRAVMSAMQGIPYTMDQSLFEDDNDVIIHNKSKFTLWFEKVWNKMAFWKHKKNKNK